MKRTPRPALVVFWAVLFGTLNETIGSSGTPSSASLSEVQGRNAQGVPRNWANQTNISSNSFSNETFGNHGNKSISVNIKHRESSRVNGSLFVNTSRANVPTVKSERSGRTTWRTEETVAPLCAYRVMEGGIMGQLCFRHTQFGFRCHKGDCRTVMSSGALIANILTNGSVLVQWTHEGLGKMDQGTTKVITSGHEAKKDETGTGQVPTGDVGSVLTGKKKKQTVGNLGGRHHRRGGFELSCWWNGSYTQFECAGVHLGSGCRDFLMTELHENVPYRICLRSLAATLPPDSGSGPAHNKGALGDCVEFTVLPSGMQDIVIAMTTVGGAICVMLVIICLLVAYITENIMSPTTPHTYSYHTHSRH